MTTTESIAYIEDAFDAWEEIQMAYGNGDWGDAHEARDMAIKSLTAWDEIRVELKDMFVEYGLIPTKDEVAYNRAMSNVMSLLNRHLQVVTK